MYHSVDDLLHFVSDRSGWWNLHRERHGRVEPLLPRKADFADAPWELDYSSYAILPGGMIACRYQQHGLDHLGIFDNRWGVLDVQDCVDVAVFLADRGDVDSARTVISGASAGGFTALRALATTDRFAAGASWLGRSR